MAWVHLGTRFIDTGYDDPVSWNNSYQIAELYAARAYATSFSALYNPVPAGSFFGRFQVEAVPCWSVNTYMPPVTVTVAGNRRVFLKLDFYYSDYALSAYDQRIVAVTGVNWALYRI